MPAEIVSVDRARAIRRKPGTNITFVNQGATDVYFDNDPGRINAALPGALTIANGTKIANSGGQVQFSAFPGVVWVRANAATTIEVQP